MSSHNGDVSFPLKSFFSIGRRWTCFVFFILATVGGAVVGTIQVIGRFICYIQFYWLIYILRLHDWLISFNSTLIILVIWFRRVFQYIVFVGHLNARPHNKNRIQDIDSNSNNLLNF